MNNGVYRDEVNKRTYEEKTRFPVKQERTEPKERTGVIEGAKNVNLRTWPKQDSKSKAILREGTKVKIRKNGIVTDGYKEVEVTSTGFVGYIFSKYVKEVK